MRIFSLAYKMQWVNSIPSYVTRSQEPKIRVRCYLKNRLAVITYTNAKSSKARALVLNEQAMQLINSLSCNSDYVFTRETHKRIYDIDRRDFKRALQLSRIDDFYFHDLRHAWASWHVQAGTPFFALKEMGGWKSLEMVRKYAHLNASHMIDFADNVTVNVS